MSERGQGWRGRRARASFCVCSSRMSGGAAVHYKPVACHDRRDRRCATSAADHADHADHADYADHVDLNPGVAWQLRSLPFWRASANAHDGNLLMSRVHALSAAICLRSEEHTSELQSPDHLVCRLLLEKKKKHQQ